MTFEINLTICAKLKKSGISIFPCLASGTIAFTLSLLIRRRNQLYTLTSVGREDLVMTPALKKRIKEVEKACREGRCIICNTNEELNSFLESL